MPRKAKRYGRRKNQTRAKYCKKRINENVSSDCMTESSSASILGDEINEDELVEITNGGRLYCQNFLDNEGIETASFHPHHTSSPIPFDEHVYLSCSSDMSGSKSLDSSISEVESDDELYENAGIKVRDYHQRLLQISSQLKLSDAGIGVINDFIAEILPYQNKCPTKYQLLKAECDDFDYQVNANTVENGIYYTLNVSQQLEDIIRRHPEVLESFNVLEENNLRDIFDGEAFQNYKFSRCHPTKYIYCLLNCDGIASVHKSKESKIWPASLVVLNLAPLKRRKFENIILSTLFCGKKKPDFNVFMKEVKKAIELCHLEENGEIIRIKVLALVADLPAKADCLNMVAFNGYFGCSICEEKGHYSLEHRKMTYPITEENAKTRDVRSHSEHVKLAAKSKPRFGVKGYSPLSELIDIPTAAPFDAMHLIYLGITRTITLYALKKNLIDFKAASNFMKNISIPKYFNRFPRNLENVSLWKASDWKVFLLYSSVPVAYHSLSLSTKSKSILTLFGCLSTIVQLLSSEKVFEQDIRNAAVLVEVFQKTLQEEFGVGSMTFSVHALKHLPLQVRQFGPLWTHSAFCFESFFGRLTRFVTGTVNEGKLMVRRFLRYHEQLYRLQPSASSKNVESVQDDSGVMALKQWQVVGDSEEEEGTLYFTTVVVGGRKFATESQKNKKSVTTLSLAVSEDNNIKVFVKIEKIYFNPDIGFCCLVEKFNSRPALQDIVSLPSEIRLHDINHCAILSSGSLCVLKCSTLVNHFVSFYWELETIVHMAIPVTSFYEHD